MPEVKDSEKLIRVRLELNEEDHQELRIEAARENAPMSRFVRDLVLCGLKERRKEKRK